MACLTPLQLVFSSYLNFCVEINFQTFLPKTLKARRITHFEFFNWPKDVAPCDPTSVLDLIRDVQKVQQQCGNHSIVVHCRYR